MLDPGMVIAECCLKWKVFHFLCVSDGMTCLLSVGVSDVRIVAPDPILPLNPVFFTEKFTCGLLPLLS